MQAPVYSSKKDAQTYYYKWLICTYFNSVLCTFTAHCCDNIKVLYFILYVKDYISVPSKHVHYRCFKKTIT